MNKKNVNNIAKVVILKNKHVNEALLKLPSHREQATGHEQVQEDHERLNSNSSVTSASATGSSRWNYHNIGCYIYVWIHAMRQTVIDHYKPWWHAGDRVMDQWCVCVWVCVCERKSRGEGGVKSMSWFYVLNYMHKFKSTFCLIAFNFSNTQQTLRRYWYFSAFLFLLHVLLNERTRKKTVEFAL